MTECKKFRSILRAQMRSRRQALQPIEIQQMGEKVCAQIMSHPALQVPQIIGSYCSSKGELDTLMINEGLLKLKQTLILPVIDPKVKGLMEFYNSTDLKHLIPNRFGILEPDITATERVKPDDISVLLVPLLAFDRHGNRLGMGGGYYDRMLKKISVSCLTIGLAYDFQEIDEVPCEAWDMPLNEIITPTRRLIIKA